MIFCFGGLWLSLLGRTRGSAPTSHAAIAVILALLAIGFATSAAAEVKSGSVRLASANSDQPDENVGESQDDSAQKFRWLFKQRSESDSAREIEPTGMLQKLDREVKEARKLYLAGEPENAILKYRSVLDNLESLLEDIPPAHPLLKDMEERLQVFDELATKILGPVQVEPQEDTAGRVFHLMEKRRICRRNLILKKAGPIKFFDVSHALLADEAEILRKLLELKSDAPSADSRQAAKALEAKLVDVRRALQKSSPRYALLRRGVPAALEEIQRDVLGKDEMILDFNLLSDRMVIGVITPEKAIYYQVPASRAEIDRGVFHLQDKLREFAVTGRASFMGHAWREPARRIYRSLLGKLPLLPSDKKKVLVIPDRSLWYLPFSVMLDAEDRPFGRGRVVSLIPSADALKFVRSAAAQDWPSGFQGDLLLFEAIPWIPEDEVRQLPSSDSRKKPSKKVPEEERIERLILSNPVYPKPSEIVVSIQKIFTKFEVSVGPTATLDKLAEYKGRGDYVALLAAPLAMMDTVQKDHQPKFFFAPDKQGKRRFACRRLFDLPLGPHLLVLPISWFDVPDTESPAAEGPLLLSTAVFYAGVRSCLINYSDPNWGVDEPFLLDVLKKFRGKVPLADSIAAYPREMPAGLDSSFSGRPPSWTGWILMGDPN